MPPRPAPPTSGRLSAQLDTFLAPNGVLLYLDEIQYFTKKQQQSLLEFIENGKITLIASTTENPYFYVYNAILSRSTVFEFKAVEPAEVERAVRPRASPTWSRKTASGPTPSPDAIEHIAAACGGDVRKALNTVELLFAAGRMRDGTAVHHPGRRAGALPAQRHALRPGRRTSHYDIVSALQKSRSRLRPGRGRSTIWPGCWRPGTCLSACRRLLVIGRRRTWGWPIPMAVTIVKACVDAALQLGLPEAQIPLAEAVVLMATAPKSNSANKAIQAGDGGRDERAGSGDIPRHLQNVHADGTGFEREQGYHLSPRLSGPLGGAAVPARRAGRYGLL